MNPNDSSDPYHKVKILGFQWNIFKTEGGIDIIPYSEVSPIV